MAKGTTDYYRPEEDLADTLTKLDTVATKLDTVATKLDTVTARLDTQISKLDDIITAAEGRQFEGYAEITTTCKQVLDSRSTGKYNVNFYAHPDNTANIDVHLLSDCSGAKIVTLAPADLITVDGCDTDLSAKAASGTQYLKVQVTGRSEV